jgi:hypothetical protein
VDGPDSATAALDPPALNMLIITLVGRMPSREPVNLVKYLARFLAPGGVLRFKWEDRELFEASGRHTSAWLGTKACAKWGLSSTWHEQVLDCSDAVRELKA